MMFAIVLVMLAWVGLATQVSAALLMLELAALLMLAWVGLATQVSVALLTQA